MATGGQIRVFDIEGIPMDKAEALKSVAAAARRAQFAVEKLQLAVRLRGLHGSLCTFGGSAVTLESYLQIAIKDFTLIAETMEGEAK